MVIKNKKQKQQAVVRPFVRLQNELSALINNAEPGDRLPSEPELARQMGVSRATLREAMRSFEGMGLIRRRQGLGTFVVGSPRVMETGLEVLESIETLAARIGLQVDMGALTIQHIPADADQSQALGVPQGAPLIRVARVIEADKRPIAYLVDILPDDILTPQDLEQGFRGSVLDLILHRGDPTLSQSVAEIQAVHAGAELARAMQIQRGDGVLMFVARLYTNTGRVVDHSLSYFLPGYFKFHVVRRVGSNPQFGQE